MQHVLGRQKLVTAILVVVLIAAASLITCSEGLHLPVFGSADATCTQMAHSSVVDATVGQGGARILASLTSGTATAFALPSLYSRVDRAPARGASPGGPIDPLNGRLRL